MMWMDVVQGVLVLTVYYVVLAAMALLANAVFHFPREVMRKILHFIFICSVFVYVLGFSAWQAAAATALGFGLVLYPVVMLAERFPAVMRYVPERKPGEIRSSLVLVQLMIAALVTVFWGALGEAWKFMIVASIMAWGPGDAAAALVGKAVGKHHIRSRFIEGAKTVEGSVAMTCVSWVAIAVTLVVSSGLSIWACLLIATLVAPVCAVVELYSRGGMDTVTVPFVAAALMSVLCVVLW